MIFIVPGLKINFVTMELEEKRDKTHNKCAKFYYMFYILFYGLRMRWESGIESEHWKRGRNNYITQHDEIKWGKMKELSFHQAIIWLWINIQFYWWIIRIDSTWRRASMLFWVFFYLLLIFIYLYIYLISDRICIYRISNECL